MDLHSPLGSVTTLKDVVVVLSPPVPSSKYYVRPPDFY